MKDCYDEIITFSQNDAKEYGFKYCWTHPYKVPDIASSDFPHSDVFFIGANKGRLGLIHDIYEILMANGLKCDFHVVGVAKEEQLHPNGIVYNRRMTYEEVLQHASHTNCILEVLQNGHDYCSLRVHEAMFLKKKLLTTNQWMVDIPFYDGRIVQIIKDTRSIDIEFFKKPISLGDYPGTEYCSFASFKEFLNKLVN